MDEWCSRLRSLDIVETFDDMKGNCIEKLGKIGRNSEKTRWNLVEILRSSQNNNLDFMDLWMICNPESSNSNGMGTHTLNIKCVGWKDQKTFFIIGLLNLNEYMCFITVKCKSKERRKKIVYT